MVEMKLTLIDSPILLFYKVVHFFKTETELQLGDLSGLNATGRELHIYVEQLPTMVSVDGGWLYKSFGKNQFLQISELHKESLKKNTPNATSGSVKDFWKGFYYIWVWQDHIPKT